VVPPSDTPAMEPPRGIRHSMRMKDEHLLDLHAELQNDMSGQRRTALLARLNGLKEQCVTSKRELQDRESYRRTQAANTALNAAIRIVETLPQTRGGGN
jgi:hypothetical protein